MDAKRFGNRAVVRIDRGEELVATLVSFCEANGIALAGVSGIGAAGEVTIGLFDTEEQEYLSTELRGDHEITSLTGSVSTMDGATYIHLHATLGDREYRVRGGHLNRAVISGTCEVVLDIIDGELDRKFDDAVGLNLLVFG